jgi:uncharacterized RDD family membrane protein YckC
MENQTTTPTASQPAVTTYAGFWVRFAALIIDNVIVFIANFIIGFFAGIFMQADGMTQSQVSAISGVLGLVVSFGYFIWMTHVYGATVGKKALGIRVVGVNGEKLSFWKVVLRETVGKILSAIIIYIGFVMAAFTSKKQGLHDFIAGSTVTQNDPNKSKTGVIVAVVIVAFLFAMVIIGILSSVVLVSLNVARGKAQEAYIKSSLSSVVPQALVYADAHNGSYKGFAPTLTLPPCSGTPIVNISPDGFDVAVFAKSCGEPKTYGQPVSYMCVTTDGKGVRPVSEGQITKTKCE